jgi:pimeloyl-ACP methyl ester carboxylesterase
MKQVKNKKPADFIKPLNINGLQGRMLHMPAPKGNSKEILFIYGHHSSLERWWGIAQVLNRYGAVTMPDLPGFGGMDSFYKIGKKPDIDTLADYLASLIKLKYKRKKVKIVGLSFGFVVATRMLQRYPDLSKNVTILTSIAGFAHKNDFSFSKTRYSFYLTLSWFFKHKIPAIVFKNIALNPLIIKTIYAKTHNAKNKFTNLSKVELKSMLEFETYLWHVNDVRTHMYTTFEFMRLNNCEIKVDMPLHHIEAKGDQYFDSYTTKQHLNVIFPKVSVYTATLDKHAPSIIADEQQAAHMFPASFLKILSS